jgi:hypothetical protein
VSKPPTPDEARRRAQGPGSGAAVLDEAHAILTRYVVFPSPQAADAVTLYAAATHAAPKLEFATRLVIKSPVKRCGKSRLLDVLGQLVRNPLVTSDISAAALVRSIGADDPPTIMLDEFDATFGGALKGDEKAEHLRGILNAGFGRDRPYKRWDITTRSVEDCPTFAMAVLAGIGSAPETIEDRAIIITLRRKAPGEFAARFRLRSDKPKVTAVGDRLSAWVTPRAAGIGDAVPQQAPGLNDRAEDAWEGLLAVADAAGGGWPDRARAAARSLSADAEEDAAESMRLLSDLRQVFGDSDRMHGENILGGLHKIAEAPWNDYFGKPLTARGLAKLLKPYSIRSRDVWIADVNRKGYYREDLWDAWQRYLPPVRGVSARSARSANGQVSDSRIENQETLGPLGGDEPSGPSGPSGKPAPSGPSASAEQSASTLTSELAHLAHLADTPRAAVHEPGAALLSCDACGASEDSIIHAVNCLGEDLAS